MRSLTYSGSFYFDGNFRFTEPGTYEVDDSKAEQLLHDFPDQFAPEGDTQDDPNAPIPTPNLSKANRAQLEAFAAEIGLNVTPEMDTNQKLKEAIESHRGA